MNMHRSNVLLLMKFSKLTHSGKVLCYETALCVCVYIYIWIKIIHIHTHIRQLYSSSH